MKMSETTIEMPDQAVTLDAFVGEPEGHQIGTVIFAHGSGSSRHSSRNQHVASIIQRQGLRTVLLDLLTPEEDAVDVRTREHRFDIPMLARRVVGAIDWLNRTEPDAGPIGLFGASTGAAAALIAAAERPLEVSAVVSRGGRPDLAEAALPAVEAPTLLIVGGNDPVVIDLNRSAERQMTADTRLEIVPGATHLFEEPGKLDIVAELATEFFCTHMTGR